MHVVESNGREVDKLVQSGIAVACSPVYVIDNKPGLSWDGNTLVLGDNSDCRNDCTLKAFLGNELAAASLGTYDKGLQEGARKGLASPHRSSKHLEQAAIFKVIEGCDMDWPWKHANTVSLAPVKRDGTRHSNTASLWSSNNIPITEPGTHRGKQNSQNLKLH